MEPDAEVKSLQERLTLKSDRRGPAVGGEGVQVLIAPFLSPEVPEAPAVNTSVP